AGAPEAAVLYCGRILEALAGAAMEAAGLPAALTCAAGLDTLHACSLTPHATHYWAHALRRSGNDARHIRRPLEPPDGDGALGVRARWLHWFFCHSRRPAVPRLTTDARSLWTVQPQLQMLIASLESPALTGPEVLGQAGGTLLLHSPALPAALAERLLDLGRKEDAWRGLRPALDRFPHDPRPPHPKGPDPTRNQPPA